MTNRTTWTVTAITADGSLTLRGHRATDLRTVPAGYVREHVELAYATTIYGAQGETTGTAHLLLGEHTSAASVYVAMTRGHDHNLIHIVADDVEDAKRQWDDVFGRDRADLGPTVAAQRAGQDVDRYGTQTPARPLDEVLAELQEAWTQQADLTDHRKRLVGERDALEQVTEIRARFAPHQQRLCAEESSAKESWRNAHSRVTDLEATLNAETADLQTRVGAAWRQDLPQSERAAGVIDQGAGRFGQRRRQVHAATDQLAAFAERWQPVHPELPTNPVDLARQVKWLHGHRVANQIDAYATRLISDAHPDADDIRQAERTASKQFEAARKARTRLDNTLCNELRPYGRAAHGTDQAGRLTTVTDQLAAVEHDLHTVTTRIDRLRDEPATRELPSDGLDTEHSQWAAEREAAARQAQERWRRHQQAHRTRPSKPDHPALHHGPSIGR